VSEAGVSEAGARHSIIAEVRVDPARRGELLGALEPIFAEVEREHGTLSYAVHVDLDDPGTVWIYEQYVDRAAFELHQASDTFEQVVRAIAGFVEVGSVIHQAAVVRAKGDSSA
jgi:quinol monooxygenase YgiN